MNNEHVICVGAGPAGLTAAYLLAKRGYPVTVLESDPNYVGGIARTVETKGYRFDIGGHRFFSRSQQVRDLWRELLPDDLIEVPRLSRIYYRGKFFRYPLSAIEALFKLGPLESTRCMLSYLKAHVFPVANPQNFEDWVSNHFGSRLFQIFFKTYTEKVWGMSCREISADWAAQRIKGLSLGEAVRNAIFPAKGSAAKSLIQSFVYPRRGPGMMWEAAAEKIRAMGGEIILGGRAVSYSRDCSQNRWTVTYQKDGNVQTVSGSHVISSAPLRELCATLTPRHPAIQVAEKLRYRDFIIVALMLNDRLKLDDNWIYIHDPGVKVGRIQNFKSWSAEMVPDPAKACYGLEYFCFEGDGLWEAEDQALIRLASQELEQIGLAHQREILDGCVVRQKKAYPVYDAHYKNVVAELRAVFEHEYAGLHLVGRNGMHKYNNQDHAMMTAMLTVENIVAGKNVYNVWDVNEDALYHEQEHGEDGASGLRQVPQIDDI